MRFHTDDCHPDVLGNFICEMLSTAYVEHRDRFQQCTAERRIPLESLVAAALAQGLRERYFIAERAAGDRS